MKKLGLQWKLSKLVELASKEGGERHSGALRTLHLLLYEMTELVEMAVSEGLIKVMQMKGLTKPMTVYRATGKEFKPVEFIDITDEYLAKGKGKKEGL